MALFPPGKGGGEGITYGYKGKGVTIHSLVDAKGMPLAIATGPGAYLTIRPGAFEHVY